MLNFIRIIAIVFLLAANLCAAPLDDKLDAFKSALKAFASSQPATAQARMGDMASMVDSAYAQEGGEANLEAFVLRAMAMYPSPEVQAAGKALLAELESQKKARDDAFTARVDAVLNALPDRLGKAQKPEDIDPILSDIQSLAPVRSGYGYGVDQTMQTIVAKINACYQFTTQWQDYLSAKNHGNTQTAQTILASLLNNRQPEAPVLIPRSQLLAASADLADTVKPAAAGAPTPDPKAVATEQKLAIFSQIKTLDDIGSALPKLDVLNIGYPQNSDIQELTRYGSVYADAKGGLPVKLDQLENQGPNMPPDAGKADLSKVKSMLLLYVLPMYLGLPPDQQPQPDETLRDYLDRLSAFAQGKSDWLMLKKVTMTQQKLGYVSMPAEFYAGLDQETAGQYALAAQSYLMALKSNSLNLPSKLVGDRLDAIKKDHPDDYADAMKRYQETPSFPPWAYARAMGTPFGHPSMGAPIPGQPRATTATTNTTISALPTKINTTPAVLPMPISPPAAK